MPMNRDCLLLSAPRSTLLLSLCSYLLLAASLAQSQMFDGIPGCRTTKLELVFVIDGSSSVSYSDFDLAKEWIHNMTLNFDISPYTTRVAVVQYSSEPRTELELDSYEDARGVLVGIDNIRYMSGNTQTGRALQYVIDQVLDKSRQGSSKVVVLLSDGASQDRANEAASALREQGIATFAVGVGDMTSSGRLQELRLITNGMGSSDESVFMVKDFRSIGQIQERLVDAVCQQTVQECPTAKHDLAFVIDASSTIGYDDFMKVKEWMKKIINAFDIGPDQTRVAVVQYSTNVQEEFNFGELLTKDEVLSAIDQMDYIMGDTHTGDALMYMLNSIYTESNGERPNVPDVAIVMTDGKAQERLLVEKAAQKVHEAGITVYSVGVADYSIEEVRIIASDPDEKFVIEALDFNLIEMERVGLIKSICQESEQTCPTASAELVFLIDGSNSIGFNNFEKIKLWLKNIVDAFQIGPYYTRIGVVQFTETPYLEIALGDHSNTQSALKAIQNIRYQHGSTNIGRAIDFTIKQVFGTARKNVPKILVTLTDGQSQDDVTVAVERAQQAGIHTLVFGVGNVAPSQLRQMVAQEDSMFKASGFEEIQRMQSKLVSLICVQAEPECSSQEVDLHFLVDGSESIGEENLVKIKTWMKNIVNSFDVGKYTTRVALTQYSSSIHPEFDLKKYATKREVVHAIEQMKLMGGPTYTGRALDFMRENGFSNAAGGRSGAPKVLIVLSDGRSGDSIEEASQRLHDNGIRVFSIGAGNTWVSAMRVIGSQPEVTHVQEAASYDAINKLRRELVGEICRETKAECANTEMDLIFLVDGSSSIGSNNFEVTKEWMTSFVRQFEIGEYNTKIGVTQYSSQVRQEIAIGDYDGKDQLIDAITRIRFATGRTNTGSALNYIRNIGFSPQHGARRGVPKVLIVFTDGDANDPVREALDNLRRNGVEVYVIGVGRANMGELSADMATESPNTYHVNNYNAIKTIQSRLLRNVCERVEPDCATTMTDLMFMVDGSTSVGLENWETVKSFMTNMTEKFPIGPNEVRVGVLQYSTWPRSDIPLGNHQSKEGLHKAIKGMEWQLGDTYTAKALRFVSRSYGQVAARMDHDATKLLIVITDGQPQDIDQVAEAVRNLHSQGWRIFAIGIGQVSLSELGVLASNPDFDHVFYANDFASTRKFQGRLTRLICGDSSPEITPSVAPPTRGPSNLAARRLPSPKRTRPVNQRRPQSPKQRNQGRNGRYSPALITPPIATPQRRPPAGLTASTLRTPPKQLKLPNGSTLGGCPAFRRHGKKSTGSDLLNAADSRPSRRGPHPRAPGSPKKRRGTTENVKSFRIQDGVTSEMRLSQVLNGGLPSEFSLICVFRMHGRTIKQDWTLLEVASSTKTHFSVAFNGASRSLLVTRSSDTPRSSTQTSTLRGPLVTRLFDRGFHKLELIAEGEAVTVMVDCMQVPTQLKFSHVSSDYSGAVMRILPQSNGTALVDIQDLSIKCEGGAIEDCCEIPGLTCSSRSSAGRLMTSQSASAMTSCGCMPDDKSPQVRKAELEQMTSLATSIATRIVEEKFSKLISSLGLTAQDLLNHDDVRRSIQALQRRSSGHRRRN